MGWGGLASPVSSDHTQWPCRRVREKKAGDISCESICAYAICTQQILYMASICIFVFVRVQHWICSRLYLLLSSCGTEVALTWALSISLQQCSLQADPLAVILRYIYVSRAEQRLAVTCVREVVALMEFYTWQPSRLHWYVFKILSRNKTRFCCLLGQVGLFLSPVSPGGPVDSTGKWWHSNKEGIPNNKLSASIETQIKGHEVWMLICIHTQTAAYRLYVYKTCAHMLRHTVVIST